MGRLRSKQSDQLNLESRNKLQNPESKNFKTQIRRFESLLMGHKFVTQWGLQRSRQEFNVIQEK
jgi:hypothetical protein